MWGVVYNGFCFDRNDLMSAVTFLCELIKRENTSRSVSLMSAPHAIFT